MIRRCGNYVALQIAVMNVLARGSIGAGAVSIPHCYRLIPAASRETAGVDGVIGSTSTIERTGLRHRRAIHPTEHLFVSYGGTGRSARRAPKCADVRTIPSIPIKTSDPDGPGKQIFPGGKRRSEIEIRYVAGALWPPRSLRAPERFGGQAILAHDRLDGDRD